MHARLTSLLRFRVVLLMVVVIFGTWLTVLELKVGYTSIAAWLSGLTAGFLVLLCTYKKWVPRNKIIRRTFAIIWGFIFGLMLIIYPLAVFLWVFPRTNGSDAESVIYCGLAVIYATCIWFSPTFERWGSSLENRLANLACAMTTEEVYSRNDDMTDEALSRTGRSVAQLLTATWMFFVGLISIASSLVMLIAFAESSNIFVGGIFVAVTSQFIWLMRRLRDAQLLVIGAEITFTS